MGSLRSVATVAAVSFFAQGIVWVVLSILAILAYSCHFEPKENISKNPTFSDMARYYFSDTSCWPSVSDRGKVGITSSYYVVLLASLHFAFNFLICIVSLILLFVIPRRSNIGFIAWLYSFLFLALAISVTDIVTSATFSSDKETLNGSPSSELAPLTNMLLLVTLLAAKGFVFWILNVTIVLYIFISATMRLFKVCKKMDEEKEARNGQVNAGFNKQDVNIVRSSLFLRPPRIFHQYNC